jgi:small-conductance mechanosensitive channel
MKPVQKILAVVLVLLLAGSVIGLLRTGQPYAVLPAKPEDANSGPAQGVVDQTPLSTARRLAKMPTSAEELPLAKEALRISDHDMDLAYAAAERELEAHPSALSSEAKEIQARLKDAEDALDADNALVERLTNEEKKATGAKKDALGHQLDLAKAHQDEHQDEVDDAKEDLNRAGGDVDSRIEALREEHKASSEATDTERDHLAATATANQSGLIHLFSDWSALHQKQTLLWNAKREAESAAALFSAKHNALEAQVNATKESAAQSAGQGNAGQGSKSGAPQLTAEQTSDLVKKAKGRSASQKRMSSLDKRVDDQKQLAANYGAWIGVVASEQRSLVHRALIGVAVILGILLLGLFFDGWVENLLGRTNLDRRQVESLKTVTRVTLQVAGVLFILLVVFGPPNQLGTFLGLAGAGLTVALKDFIVGFLGWFVLMGKNGIRLGDWVEINGVTGEVVELGMFHTVLLETGNWTDSGHPTGRRVTFTNSFAIEGHYFNFSTSGQWLWDELQVVLPAGRDPYPVVDAIQKIVLEATAETAKQAEKEWQGVTRSRDTAHTLTAAPAINVKPVVGGVEIAVRYITRATERYQLRAKLNQAAVDLLGQGFVAPPAASEQPAPKPA